jgi:hypothetical protein
MNHWLLSKIAAQVSSGKGVTRSSRQNIPMKSFNDAGRRLTAIEQNPATGSEWARLAQQGHKVVQIKDSVTNRYVAVVVDGKVKEY